MTRPHNFQDFIFSLCQYWVNYGCLWSQPYDSQMGAGTFHPHTFLKGLGPEPWRGVYVQPCRRPVDGRYGKSPYRFQHYFQLQVLLKPSPSNIIDVFLQSLEHVGINLKDNDIGLLEDDWKGPTLGAWGLGWEVRANGQEVTQFTYFQQLGGLDIDVVCGEITYGLERLFMYANDIKNGLDIPFNNNFTWGDIYFQNEFEFSHFNFKDADVVELLRHFEKCEEKVSALCEKNLVLPAYDYVLQASHAFNLLDARGAISASERQRFIGRVRDCAKKCATTYISGREKLDYPLLNKLDNDARKPISCMTTESSAITLDSAVRPRNDIVGYFYDEITDFKNKKTVDIVFELGVEEMPPSFQQSAIQELTEKIKLYSSFSPQLNISSRRISLQFTNVPLREENKTVELWGPVERIAKNSDGSLTQAGLGFCKKNNVDPNKVQFKAKHDGVFLYCEKQVEGAHYSAILATAFKNWCYALTTPLKMKWLPAEISPSFIRPVRSILALIEDKVIPLEMFGILSGNTIFGQRILSPEKIEILHANKYESILKNLDIEISSEKRKEFILNQATQIAKEIGGKLNVDENLLNKCAGLFESPFVFYAQFDENYLRLPCTLIVNVLKEHMNYFTIQSNNGNSLLPYYIGVANYKCNNIENMIEGTKNVVTGRLDDGTFYYDTDLATPLSSLREKLNTQIFQENMGTLLDKSERLMRFVKLLHEKYVLISNLNILQTAAKYCKADLKSGCVQEFPDEMQGIMGGLLARKQDILANKEESELVAIAIEQHYLPNNSQSTLPTNEYATILSLLDKLDSLCMTINCGRMPQGNKDPLGMRRLALSVARLLGLKQEKDSLNLSISDCVKLCLQNMRQFKIAVDAKIENKICEFLLDLIKASLKESFDARAVDSLTQQLIYSPIASVIPFVQVIDGRIKDTKHSLLDSLNPYRRACNLTQNLERIESVQANLLEESAEKNLFNIVQTKKEKLTNLIEQKHYSEVLAELEGLAEPIGKFFDSVMVNDNRPQIKQNRLALLFQVRKLYEDIADFSLLQV